MSERETPWTKGPWGYDFGPYDYDGAGSPAYAHIYLAWDHDDDLVVAEYNNKIPEARANARLIAAAPEMAELVDELSDRLSIEYGDAREDSDAPEIVKARALLLRIHGESA